MLAKHLSNFAVDVQKNQKLSTVLANFTVYATVLTQ